MSEGYQKLKNLSANNFIQHMWHFFSPYSHKPESLDSITSLKRFSRPWKLLFLFFFFFSQTAQMKVNSIKTEHFMGLIMTKRNIISRKKISFILKSVQFNIYNFRVIFFKRFEVPEIRLIFKTVTVRNQEFAWLKKT